MSNDIINNRESSWEEVSCLILDEIPHHVQESMTINGFASSMTRGQKGRKDSGAYCISGL